jgi:hypothetical protein
MRATALPTLAPLVAAAAPVAAIAVPARRHAALWSLSSSSLQRSSHLLLSHHHSRWLHSRALLQLDQRPNNAPSAPAGTKKKKKGDEDEEGKSGAASLFEVEADAPLSSVKTRMGRARWRARLTGRYLVFGVLVLAMGASAALMVEYYFFNPEAEVRERTTRLLLTQPIALQVLGNHIRDVTLQHAGSRGLQAHHHFPYLGRHVVSCHYVLQGTRGRAQVHVQWLKDGDDWALQYLCLDSGKYGTHVLQDMRSGAASAR